MTEYIEKNEAIKELYEVYDYEFPTASGGFDEYARMIVPNTIKNMPAADVAPVVHGRWIRPHWKNSNYCCDCSECGGEAMHRDYQWDKNGIYPICPNCGAKMDGGAD